MDKINFQDIYNFIEGNSNKVLSSINLKSEAYLEQVEYRKLICESDCIANGKCIKCGCSSPSRLYTRLTCNPDRFPSIMSEDEWVEFKRTNYDKDIYLQRLEDREDL